MVQMQYDPLPLHSKVVQFRRDQFLLIPLRLPTYHPDWSLGILHPVKDPLYPHPLYMMNAMLQIDNIPNARPIIRNAPHMADSGLLDVIYDTGAVTTMITDHGTGYMTNKKETSHQITGCLNETPKGGLHIADFKFLLRMDDTSEGFSG